MLLGILALMPALALDPSKALSQYVLSSWTLQNGLPQKTVMAIAQTNEGFLWLATEGGLVRYDGKTFVTFDEQNAPGLGDRFIRSLAAGADGSLWIGTMSGLVRYRDGQFESFRNEPETRMDIYDLCAGRDGSVWFSSDRGLRRLHDGKLRVYTTSDGLPSDAISGLAEAADGTLWVATLKGLVSFSAGRFTTYDTWDGFPGGPLDSVSIGRDGVVWIGARNGKVGRWHGRTIETWWNGKTTKGARVDCLREDRDGNLWIAFQGLGLGRMQGKKLDLFSTLSGLPSSNPDWLMEDRELNLWVGWADSGVSMLRDARFTMFGKPEGLSSDSISSVVQSADGSLWLGTPDAGLNRLQVNSVRIYSTKDGLADKAVLGLLQGREGSLWVGSGSGSITRIKNSRFTIFRMDGPLSPEVPAIAEDRAGNVWFGFDMPNGLARLRDGHFKHLPLEGRVKALAIAPDGALWIASYLHGLTRLKNGIFQTYSMRDGLSNLFLTSVYVDPQGVVWAGTALGGLNRLQDGKITKYSVDQGLSDSTVGAVIEDDLGYLWLTGPRGISRVSLRDLNDYASGRTKMVHSESFGYADGLRSVECSLKAQPAVLKTRSGQLWFATTGGLAMIDPRRIRTNEIVPTVQFGSISLAGKPARLVGDKVQMGPGSGQLEIKFAVPDFVAPDSMRVRYRLVGIDRDWIEAGAIRSASYSNLGPGKYHFEVLAANSDGRGTGKATSKEFQILPRYYQTYWFRGFCALCIGLLVWWLYLSRVRYLVRKTQELEEVVTQRTAEVRLALAAAETARELLRDQAMRDSLTGFWNRRAIFEILNGEILRCQEDAQSLCILMADLDHFKEINDTSGHLAGDMVLRNISDQLRGGLRRQEAIGRYGGEEFLVVLPNCTLATALTRAEELRRAIEAQPISIGKLEIAVTCSFGLAEFIPGSVTEELVGEADAALYVAKNEGRNCVRAQNSRHEQSSQSSPLQT
jgi:diguanylate cyclase (GGDEF)-like protein